LGLGRSPCFPPARAEFHNSCPVRTVIIGSAATFTLPLADAKSSGSRSRGTNSTRCGVVRPTLVTAAQIGDLLSTAKREVEQGEFHKWVRSRLRISPRLAQTYIQI